MSKIIVKDEFRTNELSFVPGGSTVTAVYKNGKNRVYTKVKKVESYVRAIIRDNSDVVEVLVNDKSYWKLNK